MCWLIQNTKGPISWTPGRCPHPAQSSPRLLVFGKGLDKGCVIQPGGLGVEGSLFKVVLNGISASILLGLFWEIFGKLLAASRTLQLCCTFVPSLLWAVNDAERCPLLPFLSSSVWSQGKWLKGDVSLFPGRQVNGIYKGREIREQSGEFSFTASWGWGETNSSSQFFGNSHRESQGWREPQRSHSPTLYCASIRPLALRSRSFMPWSFPVQTTTWGCCL